MNSNNLRSHGNEYCVKPHPAGWAVSCEGNSPVFYSYEKKENAIKTAKTLAKDNHADVVIQKQDGSIAKNYSFR